jgi:hypothetical protein
MGYQMPDDKMIMRCPKCREWFLYSQGDKRVVKHQLPDRLYTRIMITCPHCARGVVLPF